MDQMHAPMTTKNLSATHDYQRLPVIMKTALELVLMLCRVVFL